MRLYYLMKNGFYLKVGTTEHGFDYWEISEMIAEHKAHYSWTNDKDEALYFTDQEKANSYLAKRYRQSFFKDAEVI